MFTVESLQGTDGSLHPVQEALVREHGSQCGFCTPGFVMCLFGLYKNARPGPSRDDAVDGAVRQPVPLHRLPADPRRGAGAWPSCRRPPTGAVPASTPPAARCIGAEERELAARLARLARPEGLRYAHAGPDVSRAAHARRAGAVRRRRTRRAARSPGGTDVGLWVTKQQRALGDLIYTGRVRRAAGDRPQTATAGRSAPPRTLEPTRSRRSRREWPELAEAWERFASVPIRNAGTLGGNVANGSPIGDSMPVLIALGAAVELRQRRGDARGCALEDFYLAYQQTALRAGRIRRRASMSRARGRATLLRAYKVSQAPRPGHLGGVRRVPRSTSTATRIARRAHRLRRHGGHAAARGGDRGACSTAATGARRRPRAAGEALAAEFAPITDMRASADYRRQRARATCCGASGSRPAPAHADAAPLRVQDVAA